MYIGLRVGIRKYPSLVVTDWECQGIAVTFQLNSQGTLCSLFLAGGVLFFHLNPLDASWL